MLAGGCFWGVQAVYQHTNGVTKAVSGYAGGDKKDADGVAKTDQLRPFVAQRSRIVRTSGSVPFASSRSKNLVTDGV